MMETKTILLIEDYPDSARLVKRSLEPRGYRVLHAPDGQTALDFAQSENPDLILLDLGLPDVEGQTLVGLLKNMEKLQQVPLVAVTAWPAATAKQMAEAYGCDGYISKPIDMLTFPKQVVEYLKSE